jgi:Skp family chaperone for outer membrane proteins
MGRQEKDNIISIYDKIRDACKEVAVAKKIDLVLAEHKPEIPAKRDQLTGDQVRQIINQQDVLYSNEKVDITQEVILVLNKKYGGGAAPKGDK